MRMIKTFFNKAEATEFYLVESEDYFNSILKNHNIDIESLSKMEVDELEEKKSLIDSLLKNKQFINTNSKNYINNKDFKLRQVEENFHGLRFTIDNKLERSKFYIQNRKEQITQKSSVNSIKKLVRELPETETKTKIEVEIQDLAMKNEEIIESQPVESKPYVQIIELEKHKTDMLAKKADVWLKFLAKESIASILGAILLLFLGISIIVIMFFDREPIKIVETSFLLILGYFFGQSISRNKDS